MAFIIKNNGPAPQLEPEIIRLQGLVRDLENIRRGQHPTRPHWPPAPGSMTGRASRALIPA
jgi:hypothetical protein